MALTRKIVSVTIPASGNLATNQHRLMTIDDNGRLVAGADAATPFVGVLLNKPSAIDQAAEVAILGSIVKVEAGAAVNERDRIRAVAGGRGSPTTTAVDFVCGIALTPASGSGVLFEMIVQPDRAGTAAF